MSKKLNSQKLEISIQYNLREINMIKRTIENNTHEVIEDKKIKRITSWRKSENKFKNNLIYNILSFGILHLISLFFPNIYVKLYCIPWPAKECDFFLIENIYGKLTLCERIHKKNKNNNANNNHPIKENISKLNITDINLEFNDIIKNVIHSFEYKSCIYEYVENKNEIIPIYMNLSKITNNEIFNYFSEGLSSKWLVTIISERYGKNEYKLNLNLIYAFFFKSQIPSLAIIILIGFIEYISQKNYKIMLIKIFSAITILIIQLINIKFSFINKYKKEYTLDGNNNKVRVKRKYLIKDEEELFNNLNIEELLPGDIILLKNNEYVPCDCIILHGECLVSESDLTGSLNIYKKIALKNNPEYFNYKYSNINTLYHGMKIIKMFSKSNNGFISALCINTGSNTFKANLYSNTLYFLERKKEYKNVYNLFGVRKKIFLYIILNIIICSIITIVYYFEFLSSWDYYISSDFFKNYISTISVAVICKSLMALYFIIHNILIFIVLLKLNKLNIVCFDESRLLKAGNINTIIFNKTETLSETELKIYSYHPVSFSTKKPNKLIFKNYLKNQSKDLNKCLFEYYKKFLNNDNKSKLRTVLFLECLLCCNNVEKYDTNFFGNNSEIELFNDMKWDIEQNEENNILDNLKFKFIHDINNSNYNFQYYYISNTITEIFPNNFYELKKSINNVNNINNELNIINKEITSKIEQMNYPRSNTIKITSSSQSNQINQIQKDISNITNCSYKLKIYKKFIINGSLDSASIVYNPLTNELRFMIKCSLDKIINKCNIKTLPKNFEKIISIHIKNGLIILVCATKKLNIDEFDENAELEYYMKDLNFIGFITLQNKIKSFVKQSIKEIKKYNDNLIIVSGDNIYNCLSAGLNSGIIEKRNIFILDKDTINNKINIRKICSHEEGEKIGEGNYNIKENKDNSYSRLVNNVSYININSPNFDDIPQLDIGFDKKRKIIKHIQKRRRMKKNISINELINPNSEYEKINKKEYLIKDDYRDKSKNDNSSGDTKKSGNINIQNNNKKVILNDNISDDSRSFKYLNFMEKYSYKDTFKDYTDVKDSIFCLSNNLFNYLYYNKNQKGAKKFLDTIIKKAKIFFNMSSIDKSDLIDYFRENPNNTVCVIGQCDSDIDSILSADIGINLKNPKNMNTILNHFFSIKNNILCIKDIILNGKIFLENNVILENISFICSMFLCAYILVCILRNVFIDESQIIFLEVEFLILSALSFAGKTKEKNINLNQNSKLLICYYYFQLGENIIVKLLSVYLFCSLFRGDYQFEDHKLDIEFQSFIFVLVIEFLISGILSFNFISFYRESIITNFYLIVTIYIYLIYMGFLIFFNSSNYSINIFSLTDFTSNEKSFDSFSDKNRLYLLISMLFDFFGTIISNWITSIIFQRYIK